MAKILEHMTTEPTGYRYPDEWIEPKSYLSPPKLKLEEAWMQEYEMRLINYVRYRIARPEEEPYAREAAEKRLVHHLYGEQLALVSSTLNAISSGSSKREVIELLIRLKESMS